MTKENSKANLMGTKKIGNLIFTMALPPIISMLIGSLYNIVDSIYVTKISTDALTAVSLAFPMQNLVLAAAVGLGVGVNSCIARSLGMKNQKLANDYATNGLLLLVLNIIIFLLLGFFAIKPFINLFGEQPHINKMACDYLYLILSFSFGQLFAIFFEKILQATGRMLAATLMQAFGAIVNIILDPILIFGKCGLPAMGVRGAAIATVTAQITSAIVALLLYIFLCKDVRIKFKGFKPSFKLIRNINVVGVPNVLMIAMPSLVVAILNKILVTLTSVGVAVLGVYFKLQTFVFMPVSGLMQGVRPIIGYNYGAKEKDRLKKIIKYVFIIALSVLTVGNILFASCAPYIMKLFNAEGEMLTIGVSAVVIISFSFVFSGYNYVMLGIFDAVGKGWYSLIVTVIRQFALLLILVEIFIQFMGVTGVWVAFPVTEALTCIISYLLFKHLDLYNSMDNEKTI